MKCPIDGEKLVIAERSGVEIDYCPRCRGVWLDRGELDKIISRSADFSDSFDPARHNPRDNDLRLGSRDRDRDRDRDWDRRDRRRDDDDDDDDDRRRSRKRRSSGSFLSELFDFD